MLAQGLAPSCRFTFWVLSGNIRPLNRPPGNPGLSGQVNISPTNAAHDQLLRVTDNRPLSPSHFLLTLESDSIASIARAGQFVMLRPATLDPLLPRPMSICNVLPGRPNEAGQIQVLHKVVGRGTALLAKLSEGDRLWTLGPLGKPFDIPAPSFSGSRVLMVAGGIGIAIFPFLVSGLKQAGLKAALLFGARHSEDLVGQVYFEENGVEVRTVTEDGSAGRRGMVTSLLEEALSVPGEVGMVYACGPQAMLKAVSGIVNAAAVPCQLSLEGYMGCGIGACLGCVVPVRRGSDFAYVRICVEGPSMMATEVLWD